MKGFDFEIKCLNCGHTAVTGKWVGLECCPKCGNTEWFRKEHGYRCTSCNIIIGHRDETHIKKTGKCRRCGARESRSVDRLWMLDKLFLLLTFQRAAVGGTDFDYRDHKK